MEKEKLRTVEVVPGENGNKKLLDGITYDLPEELNFIEVGFYPKDLFTYTYPMADSNVLKGNIISLSEKGKEKFLGK